MGKHDEFHRNKLICETNKKSAFLCYTTQHQANKMNHHGNMEMDPLSYDYPAYNYQAPTYPYPNKLQAMYHAYAQTNTNFVPTTHNTHHTTHNIPEPVKPTPPPPTSQVEVKEVSSNDNVTQPTSKRKKKEKKGEKKHFLFPEDNGCIVQVLWLFRV